MFAGTWTTENVRLICCVHIELEQINQEQHVPAYSLPRRSAHSANRPDSSTHTCFATLTSRPASQLEMEGSTFLNMET